MGSICDTGVVSTVAVAAAARLLALNFSSWTVFWAYLGQHIFILLTYISIVEKIHILYIKCMLQCTATDSRNVRGKPDKIGKFEEYKIRPYVSSSVFFNVHSLCLLRFKQTSDCVSCVKLIVERCSLEVYFWRCPPFSSRIWSRIISRTWNMSWKCICLSNF